MMINDSIRIKRLAGANDQELFITEVKCFGEKDIWTAFLIKVDQETKEEFGIACFESEQEALDEVKKVLDEFKKIANQIIRQTSEKVDALRKRESEYKSPIDFDVESLKFGSGHSNFRRAGMPLLMDMINEGLLGLIQMGKEEDK